MGNTKLAIERLKKEWVSSSDLIDVLGISKAMFKNWLVLITYKYLIVEEYREHPTKKRKMIFFRIFTDEEYRSCLDSQKQKGAVNDRKTI